MHGLCDDVAHLQETALILQETTVHDLIGRIHNTRHVAALVDGLEGEGQATELVQVGLKELQMLGLEQVETLATQMQTLGE